MSITTPKPLSIAAVSLALGAGACLAKPDTDDTACGPFGLGCQGHTGTWWETGGWDDGPADVITDLRDIHGTAGVYIVDLDCTIIWEMSGPHSCSTCDLMWDVSLTATDTSTCSFATDTAGTFQVTSGAAYFNGDYWAAAAAAGNAVAWETIGYVYGAAGYAYVYAGSAAY